MKDTEQLENEISKLNNADDVKNFVNNNQENFYEFTLETYLKHLLETKHLTKLQVIEKSELEQIYVYHIFAGRKKHPSREKMISLALGMSLDLDETQRLLYYAGAERLYARNPWDSIIMFALENHLSVSDTNELLSNLSEPATLGN